MQKINDFNQKTPFSYSDLVIYRINHTETSTLNHNLCQLHT